MTVPRILLLALMFCCAAVGAAHAERRVALVIGNGAYADEARLDNAPRDAALVAAALGRVGFDVTLVENLDKRTMGAALRTFEQSADGADVALLYYAGHGLAVDGQNWLLPIDARVDSARHLDDVAIPATRLLASVRGARGLQIVVLDACRNNPFARDMAGDGAHRGVVARGLARVPDNALKPNTLVAYAARDGSTAQDGERGTNGPYARAFAAHVTEPGVEIGLMFRRVRDDVLQATGNEQEPFTYGTLGGQEVYLVPRPAVAAVIPAPAPAPMRTIAPTPTVAPPLGNDRSVLEAAFWASVRDSNDPRDLEAYLQTYPNGTFAELARLRLTRLRSAAAADAASHLLAGGAVPNQLMGTIGRTTIGPASNDARTRQFQTND